MVYVHRFSSCYHGPRTDPPTSVENGDGASVARNFYDTSGRLTCYALFSDSKNGRIGVASFLAA
jgi:hypothetical protein